MQRAATSISLKLGEGRRRRAGNQRKAFEIAHGEAAEVRVCLEVVAAWGWVVDSVAPLETLDRLLALLWRLTNGRAPRHELPSNTSIVAEVGSSP